MTSYPALFVPVLCMTLVPVSFAAESSQILSGETVYQAKYQLQLPLGLPAEHFIVVEDNPLNEDKIELGQMLFFDQRLSADGTISCATCHLPQLAFTDGRQQSQGISGMAVQHPSRNKSKDH
jgi:cytochrome c peroxidase